MTDASQHISVLPNETLSHLNIYPTGIYLDATFGGGGHAQRILQALVAPGQLIVIDQDPAAIARAEDWQAGLTEAKQAIVHIWQGNFARLEQALSDNQLPALDGALFDLGWSSDQLAGGRGFSMQDDAPLDMRYSPEAALTAADLLLALDENDLADCFHRFGEEPRSRPLAREIVARRSGWQDVTARQLFELIKSVAGPAAKKTAARVFQALRIVVNREFESLERGLEQAIAHLKPGGRIVVIAFHSLEDRMVKNTFRRHTGQCTCFKPPDLCRCELSEDLEILTPKPIRPGPEELSHNPRARSARLRVAHKVG